MKTIIYFIQNWGSYANSLPNIWGGLIPQLEFCQIISSKHKIDCLWASFQSVALKQQLIIISFLVISELSNNKPVLSMITSIELSQFHLTLLLQGYLHNSLTLISSKLLIYVITIYDTSEMHSKVFF